MALMNSLLSSWNFDKLSGSNVSGEFVVFDTSNEYYGLGISFDAGSSEFLLKEDIKTNKKVNFEFVEGSDTIQTLEEDDNKIDYLHKPSSLQLVFENSMYQIISDEMMNMFSTINAYSFKFSEAYNMYKPEYNKLIETRHDFFSKIVDKPSLEKYLEFYKWLDSSLGYMLDQLKPESANNISGLKNTIESHAFERNKYQYKLPLLVQKNKNYSSGVVVTSNKSLKSSKLDINLSDEVEDLYNIKNKKNINFKNNYEFINTAGKSLNNRGNKPNKTVFQTRFSSVDHLSDLYRDETGEYSIYNSLNNRAFYEKKLLNYSSSVGTGIQGQNTVNNFRDNNFVQRNIPYTSSNYHNLNEVFYQNVPNEEVLFRHRTNLLIDHNNTSYWNSGDIVEPPVQQNVPVKQNLKIDSGFENINIYSPYSAQIDDFSKRNLIKQNSLLIKHISGGYNPIPSDHTVYNKIIEAEKHFEFNKFEKLEVIFPRTDLIGLAEVRTKSPSYSEEIGSFQTESINTLPLLTYDPSKINYWTDNSFNNNSSKIRSFWKETQNSRKRTNGFEADNLENRPSTGSLGSFNCLNFPNRKTLEYISDYFYQENNIHNSMYSMDCNVDYTINDTNPNKPERRLFSLTCSNEIYGELAPYSHFQLFNLTNIYRDSTYNPESLTFLHLLNPPKVQPKISFIHSIFVSNIDPLINETNGLYDQYKDTLLAGKDSINLILNKSYQSELDCRIKPWYDNYEDYRANIKHKSQTHSIIPEFIVSRYENVIKEQFVELFEQKIVKTGERIDSTAVVNISNYLTINGGERYDQIRKQNYKVDLKNFIDKKSNKIKFKLNAIKKILPYNGFYPQQRTPQIATIFSDTYLTDTGYITDEQKINIAQTGDNSDGIDDTITTNRILASMQPLFNPGILFNTIKAGIALPWQTYKLDSATGDRVCEGMGRFENFNDKVYFVKNLNVRLPFETILDPYKYYANGLLRNDYTGDFIQFELSSSYCIPYLDPSHKAYDIDLTSIATVEEAYNSRAKQKYTRKINVTELIKYLGRADDRLYKSAMNNFLAETNNFFCSNTLATIVSSNSDTVTVEGGLEYTMDVVLEKSQNFSMFNQYSDKIFGIIPSASLFGPPCTTMEFPTASYLNPDLYIPYAPPYFYEDRNIMRLSYSSAETKEVKISDIINNLTTSFNSGTMFPYDHKLNVYDSINYKIISGSTWVIQTKFEAPLFNFDNCSYVETGSALYYRLAEINRG